MKAKIMRISQPCSAPSVSFPRLRGAIARLAHWRVANVLLRFIHDVNRSNLRINFDPANLILYGSDDPIAALRVLGPLVVSVHAKDGDWPPRDVPGALGSERPLGQGSVGMERFVQTL